MSNDDKESAVLPEGLARLYARVRYGRAARIFTHLTMHERLQLVELAADKPDGDVVEVGSYLGASACFIAAGLERSGRPDTLHCVDTWHNDAMSEGPRDTYREFLVNTHSYQHRMRTHRGRSIDIATSLHIPVAMLFLDGDHTYDAVRADAEVWLPKVIAGGTVVLHDIGWAEGVQRVRDEIVKPLVRDEHQLPNLYWATVAG